jgi:hypothetical protein
MKIGFFVYAMNLRGVANSIFKYAYYNQTILKNKSYIIYDKSNKLHQKNVIKKFKKNFITIDLKNIKDIKNITYKIKLDILYSQIGYFSDYDLPKKISLVHLIFPQPFYKFKKRFFFYVSKWLSKECSNNKIPYLPLIIDSPKSKSNLRKQLKIRSDSIVFGCHGGSDSFDIPFVKFVILKILKIRKDIFFLFLNIDNFANHPNILYFKGTINDEYKFKFINTCDAMLHARTLGESFGISCAEFAVRNKPIFTYKFSRDRAHIDILKKKIFLYSSEKSLFNSLNKFNKNNFKNFITANHYKDFTPKKIMKKFQKLYINKNLNYKINLKDYLIVFFYQMRRIYYYIRHKIYYHYFNFFRLNNMISIIFKKLFKKI